MKSGHGIGSWLAPATKESGRKSEILAGVDLFGDPRPVRRLDGITRTPMPPRASACHHQARVSAGVSRASALGGSSTRPATLATVAIRHPAPHLAACDPRGDTRIRLPRMVQASLLSANRLRCQAFVAGARWQPTSGESRRRLDQTSSTGEAGRRPDVRALGAASAEGAAEGQRCRRTSMVAMTMRGDTQQAVGVTGL
jgi:hypothetical protein